MTEEQPPQFGDGSDPMIGRLLDHRYRILDRVARGGMAAIYRADDIRLDRVVAVKVMHPGLAEDEAFETRFVREARAAAKLSHPHVVAVHDQGSDSSAPGRPGTLYLVMEYVEGRTLRDLIREQAPMRPGHALGLLKPVLQALAAAHAVGLVHRDVKPENVLISRTGQVKVADFGLAKAVSADTQHTATGGVLIGTVSYLAPELVVEGRIDPRVDVYAAGVLLFEMLTGRKPHEGETPIQIAYAHVHTDVPPPSSLVPGLPDYVDALVARATARDRTLRPADAAVLLRHVDRVSLALAQGVESDPELTADLTPMVVHPHTGELLRTDTAPDPFDEADLAALRTPLETPLDAPEGGGSTGTESAPGSPGGAAPARPHPSQPGQSHQSHQAGTDHTRPLVTRPHDVEPTRTVPAGVPAGYGTSGFPPAGPEHTARVPLDDIPLAAHPGEVAQSRRARRAAAKAQRAQSREHDQTGQGGQKRPRRRRLGAIALVLALVLALAIGGGAWWFGWARYTETPGVIGLDKAAATSTVTDAGLEVELGPEVFSETVAAGRVVRTEPELGERVLKDGAVTLFVSKGPERYEVPAVANLNQVEAEDALRKVNLEIESVKKKFSETVGTDLVISSDPATGTLLRRGDTVTLTISKGRRPYKVKSFVGKKADDAEKALEKHFEVARVEENSDTVPKGNVISQTPSSGTLYTDELVGLVVSKGPVMVDVPVVVGDDVDDATAELKDLGFKVEVQRNDVYLGLGRVYAQSPGFGSTLPKGSTVTLSVV